MTVRRQTDCELVIETPHRRLGTIERPLVTIRRGLGHVLVEDKRGKGDPLRLPLERAETVRLVPAARAGLHGWRRGGDRWTVVLRFKSGEDLLLEQGLESTSALALATTVCDLCGLSLDEPTRRMFGLADVEQGAES